MINGLGDSLVAAFMARGATAVDLEAMLAALNAGDVPNVPWLNTETQPDVSVDFGRMPMGVTNLMVAHGLETHRALRLVSLPEIMAMSGFQVATAGQVKTYCQSQQVELRGSTTIVAQGAALYGSIRHAPFITVLSVALPKTHCSKQLFLTVCGVIAKASIQTFGQLMAMLAMPNGVPGLDSSHKRAIDTWLARQGLL